MDNTLTIISNNIYFASSTGSKLFARKPFTNQYDTAVVIVIS